MSNTMTNGKQKWLEDAQDSYSQSGGVMTDKLGYCSPEQATIDRLKSELADCYTELEQYRGVAMTQGAEKALADYEAMKLQRDELVEALEKSNTLLINNLGCMRPALEQIAINFLLLNKIKESKI